MDRLNSFFHAIQSDNRIGISHIALYTAILQYGSSQSQTICIRLFSKEIMQMAKISSSSTYHRCLNDLKDWNYILYRPSYNRLKASEIELKTLSNYFVGNHEW